MATKKVKVPPAWNAKPVTKLGGGSAGVRDPRKPYVDKPKNTRAERPARWDAKTNIEKLREAAKTKPNTPAPRAKPPASSTGPVRPSIGNVKGPASSPNRPAATPKPSAKPAGNFRAPSVPPAGSATKPQKVYSAADQKWLADAQKARSQASKGTPLGARPLSSLVSQRGVGANALVSAIAQAPEEFKRLQSGYYDLSKPNSDRRANLTRALGSDPGTAAWNPFKSKPNPNDPKPGTVGPPTPKNNLASSVKGRSVGQQAVKGGKAVTWDGYKWAPSKSVGNSPVGKAPPAPKLPAATNTASRSSSPSRSSRSSGGSSMSSPVRTSSPKPAAPQVKQSKDMNENYNAWAAANPTLAAKVKKGQAGYNAISKDAVAGMGPVRDSASYKPSVSSSDTASTDKKDSLKIATGSSKNFRIDIALLDKKNKK